MEGPKPVRPKRQNRNGPVETLYVHPDVWALALILAGNNAARITDRKPFSVIIVNREK
jgi:hypothetical protein